MPLILPARTLDSDYDIDNSLRFPGDAAELTREQDAGNRKTWTCSLWVKMTPLNQGPIWGTPSEGDQLHFSSQRLFFMNEGSSGSYLSTTKVFRDPSAWYHLVIAFDTTQGTAANRVKLYINGSQYTWDTNTTFPDEDDEFKVCQDGQNFRINAGHGGVASNGSQCYYADFAFVDGTAYAASYFGETNDNGVWIPKKPDVTWGTNGFFLEFQQTGTSQNASGMGADTSGNGNHFAVTDLTSVDVTEDTPTNNFCTWNPLVVRGGSDDLVYTEGNTGVSSNQHATNNYTFGTQGFANGKWYWEVECETVGGEMHIGIVDSGSSTTGYPSPSRDYRNNGNKETNGGSGTSFGNTFTDGDIIGVAVDLDNTSIYYSKNGTWQNSGDPESGSSKTGAAYTDISSTNFSNFVLPWVAGVGVNGGADVKAFANFGNPPFSISSGNADANGYGNFEYAVPSGYYALCTKNLAEYG